MNIIIITGASSGLGMEFAKALREEMKRKDINIFVFSPRNMDTEMNARNNIKEHNEKIAMLPYLDIKKTETRKALKKAEDGKGIYTPLFLYKVYRLLVKIISSSVMMKFTNIEK